MGYRIDYQSVAESGKTKQRHHPFLIFALCALAILLLNSILKEERSLLLNTLFPGDAAVTVASLDHMLMQMKTGTPFPEAFRIFCRQVIAG